MLHFRLARLPVPVQDNTFVRLVATTSVLSLPSVRSRQEVSAAGTMTARSRRKAAAPAANGSTGGAGGTGSRLAEELVGEVEEQVESLERRSG